MLNLFKRKRAVARPTGETLLHKNLSFSATEAYKLLRTNVLFTLPDSGKCRIVGVTSSIRGEGKSTTSVNLSYALSMQGKRVLLVDADMRLPTVAKKLEIVGEPGLSDTIIKADGGDEYVQTMDGFENWYILPAGNIPPNPTEMLSSPHMAALLKKLSESYDFIILDLPPVNVVSDALIASELLDGVIVVVRQNYSTRREVTKCIKQLELSGAKLLGFVMSAVKENRGYYKHGGSHYDGYGEYGYDRGSRGDDEPDNQEKD